MSVLTASHYGIHSRRNVSHVLDVTVALATAMTIVAGIALVGNAMSHHARQIEATLVSSASSSVVASQGNSAKLLFASASNLKGPLVLSSTNGSASAQSSSLMVGPLVVSSPTHLKGPLVLRATGVIGSSTAAKVLAGPLAIASR